MKCSRFSFFWKLFFWSFFGQVWGNLGNHYSHLQKFACFYTYDSKHKILEIPDLFNCQMPNSCIPFYNGGLPNHFDNYFAEISSVHKYKKSLASLQKYYLPRTKTSLGQLSWKYIGPKIWSNIPENLKSSLPYSFGKQYINVLLSCQNSCWFLFYMLVTFCNIVLMPLFSLLFISTVAHPTPCT